MAKAKTPPEVEDTVAKTPPEIKETEANARVAEEDRSDDFKCDNHPHRKARNFTGNGSYSVNFCDECTPPWFSV